MDSNKNKKIKQREKYHKNCIFATSKKSEMASFESIYNKIEYNVKSAITRMKELREENSLLQKENDRLKTEAAELRQQLVDKDEKLKLLVVTKKILYKEDKTEIKKQINDWVREIDNCIELLKER